MNEQIDYQALKEQQLAQYRPKTATEIQKKIRAHIEQDEQAKREKIKREWELKDLGIKVNPNSQAIDIDDANKVKKVMQMRRERLRKAAEGVKKILTPHQQAVAAKERYIRDTNSELLNIIGDDLRDTLKEFRTALLEEVKEVIKENVTQQTEVQRPATNSRRTNKADKE